MVSPPPPPTSQTWHPAMMLPITVAGLAFGTPSAAGSLHWLARAPSIGSVSAAPAPPPDPMSAPPFRVALARAFDRLSAARLAAEAHPSRHLLPSSCPVPVLHTPILDGPVQQPATSPPRRPTVPILTPLRRLTRERSHTLFRPPLPPSFHATFSTSTPQPHPLAAPAC